IRPRRRRGLAPGQETILATLPIMVFVLRFEKARVAYHEKAASATGNAKAKCAPGSSAGKRLQARKQGGERGLAVEIEFAGIGLLGDRRRPKLGPRRQALGRNQAFGQVPFSRGALPRGAGPHQPRQLVEKQ